MINDDTFTLLTILMVTTSYLLFGMLGSKKPEEILVNINALNNKLNMLGKIVMVPMYILNYLRYVGGKMPILLKKLANKVLKKRD